MLILQNSANKNEGFHNMTFIQNVKQKNRQNVKKKKKNV